MNTCPHKGPAHCQALVHDPGQSRVTIRQTCRDCGNVERILTVTVDEIFAAFGKQ